MKTNYIFIAILFIIISGCSAESELITKYKIVYEPVKGYGISSYYVAGLPFGAVGDNKYSVMFNLQLSKILEENYFRLWMLYENLSEEDYLLEPISIVKLELWKKGAKKFAISPESPLKILTNIEEDKQRNLIFETIGAALKTLTVKNTTMSVDGKKKIEINDGNEKREEINKEYENDISNIDNWYNLYTESVNNGLLRKNTLFKNKSVNGYLYFKMPLIGNIKSFYLSEINPYDYEAKVAINTHDGVKEVMFKQVAGE